jgi:hypothetical protein
MDGIIDTFMFLLDGPPTRNYLRPHVEIEVSEAYQYLYMLNSFYMTNEI